MEENEAIQSLAALAQPMRLRIFRTLVVAGISGKTPTQLAENIAVAGATLSFHLKELAQSQLISQERDGRNLIYRANFHQMNGLLAYLTEHCCQGEACIASEPACKQC